RRSMTGAALLGAALTLTAPAAPAIAQHTADDLRAVERAWLDAYENNDVDAMRRIVADGFVITYSSGRQRDKAETIASLNPDAPNDPNSRMYTTDETVRFFGDDVAVITGTFHYEVKGDDDSVRRDSSLYTDVYRYMDDRWQVIASHLSKPPRTE
ncbi:MAG: nuclear transport factor 2 family protein, partial [Gemmatimonadales bacterium]